MTDIVQKAYRRTRAAAGEKDNQFVCVKRPNCACRMTYPGLVFLVRWWDKRLQEGLLYTDRTKTSFSPASGYRKCKPCRVGDTRGNILNSQSLSSPGSL